MPSQRQGGRCAAHTEARSYHWPGARNLRHEAPYSQLFRPRKWHVRTEHDDAGGAIADLLVLAARQLHQQLADLVLNLHLVQDRGAVIGCAPPDLLMALRYGGPRAQPLVPKQTYPDGKRENPRPECGRREFAVSCADDAWDCCARTGCHVQWRRVGTGGPRAH